MSITTNKMNIILASLTTLPELINGKLCIINDNGSYELLNPSQYTTIQDNYNPMDYSILISSKYSRCIVYSTQSEKNNYLVNKQYQKLINKSKNTPELFRISDKIHITSRRGIYEIVAIYKDTIEITCNKWQYQDNKTMIISKEDFQCLAGGIKNYAE